MKTVRILLLLALSSAIIPAQAMWLRAGKAIASRFAARVYKPMQQTFKATAAPQYKPMAAFRTSLLESFRNKRALGAAALATTGLSSYAYQHRTSQEIDFVKKGGTIAIQSLAGNINVEGWDQDRLEIKTCKEAHSQEALDQSAISMPSITRNGTPVFTRIQDKVTVDGGEYTYDNPPAMVIANNELTIAGKPAARIRYDIRAPHYSNLIVSSIAGNIALTGILGSVDARSNNGNIKTTRCNNVDAYSMNGNITLALSYGKAKAESMVGNVSISNNQAILDEAAKYPLLDTKGFALEHATAKSTTGNATVSGALKGKASSTTGKASFNGQTGSSIWWE